MDIGVPTRVIAASLALGAFAIATVAGLAVGNPLLQTIIRATISMIACYLFGLAIGSVAERTVRDHVREYVTGAKTTAAGAAAGSDDESEEGVLVV